MDNDGWYRGRSDGRAWAWVVLWGLGAMLLTAVAVHMLLAGTGVLIDSSEPRGTTSIVESVLWLAGAIVCFLFAIHFEHRARGLPHGKITSAAEGTVRGYFPAGRHRGSFRPSRRYRRHGPLSTLTGGIVFTLAGVGIAAGAVGSHVEAAKSSYTQAHGVPETATVTYVDNEKSCGRSSCTYYAYVTVTLQPPVGGRTSTVVSVPRNVLYISGEPVRVLVDPKDPGYAELPGSPYETNADTVGLALFAVLMLALGVAGIVRGVRMHGREHAWRAS